MNEPCHTRLDACRMSILNLCRSRTWFRLCDSGAGTMGNRMFKTISYWLAVSDRWWGREGPEYDEWLPVSRQRPAAGSDGHTGQAGSPFDTIQSNHGYGCMSRSVWVAMYVCIWLTHASRLIVISGCAALNLWVVMLCPAPSSGRFIYHARMQDVTDAWRGGASHRNWWWRHQRRTY